MARTRYSNPLDCSSSPFIIHTATHSCCAFLPTVLSPAKFPSLHFHAISALLFRSRACQRELPPYVRVRLWKRALVTQLRPFPIHQGAFISTMPTRIVFVLDLVLDLCDTCVLRRVAKWSCGACLTRFMDAFRMFKAQRLPTCASSPLKDKKR